MEYFRSVAAYSEGGTGSLSVPNFARHRQRLFEHRTRRRVVRFHPQHTARYRSVRLGPQRSPSDSRMLRASSYMVRAIVKSPPERATSAIPWSAVAVQNRSPDCLDRRQTLSAQRRGPTVNADRLAGQLVLLLTHEKNSFDTTRTVPASPSTSTSWPSWSSAVAFPVPTTAGMPYSRATSAQWLRMPPVSETTAAAVAKSGVHVSRSLGENVAAEAAAREALSLHEWYGDRRGGGQALWSPPLRAGATPQGRCRRTGGT
jgi:hypothetical protein